MVRLTIGIVIRASHRGEVSVTLAGVGYVWKLVNENERALSFAGLDDGPLSFQVNYLRLARHRTTQ